MSSRARAGDILAMKLRDLRYALPFRARPREYPATITTFTLPTDGTVRFARWHHPAETPKVVSQRQVDALRSFLRPGDIAVDVGAHTGDSTLPIALAVGSSGTVFALEPNPYVFKVLEVNATLNPEKTHIVPLMFAAMPHDGQFVFEYSDEGFCNGGFHDRISRWRHGHFVKLRVEGRHLGSYLRRQGPDAIARLRYIKVDTEGFDRSVVASLRDILQTARPYLRVEIYKHLPPDERGFFFDDLRDLGYRLFKYEEDRNLGLELTRDAMNRWPHFDLFAVAEERA
jgi:FkbM family methyltransferase